MKMMKCHFCQQEGPQHKTTVDTLNYYCSTCPKGELKSVISSYESEILGWNPTDRVRYAHMYVVFGNKDDRICHVRLHLSDDHTIIMAPNTKIIEVPHFPLNPNNVVDKLKLYLLFS